MTDTSIPQSIDIMARTLIGEIEGGTLEQMQHVAMVIRNRADHPRWWGRDIISVCKAPYQFSCWNADSPRLHRMNSITLADPLFKRAVAVAEDAISRRLQDVTDGADSYYALSMPQPPNWAAKATKTFADGAHVFFRVELPEPVKKGA